MKIRQKPLLLVCVPMTGKVIDHLLDWIRGVFGFIEIWRQTGRSTAKLIGRGRRSSNYPDHTFVRNLKVEQLSAIKDLSEISNRSREFREFSC